MDWVQMDEGRDTWRAVVKTVTNFSVP